MVTLGVFVLLSACGEEVRVKGLNAPQPNMNAPQPNTNTPDPYWSMTKFVQYNPGTVDIVALHAWDSQNKGYVTYGAGADSVLDTTDDVVTAYSAYEFSVVGNKTMLLRGITYSASGVDGIWFTSDDVISTYTDYEILTLNNGPVSQTSAIYANAGGDGIWFTADDVATARYQYTVSGGVLTEYIRINNDGTHNECYRYYFNANSSVTGLDKWAAWSDGTCFTADDVMASYVINTLGAGDALTAVYNYNSPGPDVVWKAGGDDILAAFNEYTYDGSGNFLTADYKQPGADNLPNTADDICTTQSHNFQTDAAERRTFFQNSGSGADGLCGTADDFLWKEYWYGAY